MSQVECYILLSCFMVISNCTSVLCYTEGVQGILSGYQMCISQVKLYGPTNFAPIIYHVAQFAAAAKQEPVPKVCCAFIQPFDTKHVIT